jgi:hypothetical protein
VTGSTQDLGGEKQVISPDKFCFSDYWHALEHTADTAAEVTKDLGKGALESLWRLARPQPTALL